MRVISGRYRGLKLNEFEGSDIRPTADRVKESLFNILFSRIAGAEVCDLFCGSGSLGIECLSRGAARADFNDLSPRSIKVLKGNLARLKGQNNYTVTCGDYSAFLRSARAPYDIIFIDPPYADDCGISALQIVGGRNLLKEEGLAVYERDRPFEGHICGLEKVDERKYGKTYLTFFARAAARKGEEEV